MKDIKGKLALGLVCLVLGLIISMQFKTVRNTTDGGFLSTQRAQQLTVELKRVRTEKDRLNKEMVELDRRLKEYEQSEVDESFIIKNLKNDLQKYQILSGYSSVEGDGIVITLEDAPTEYPTEGSFLQYNYEYMLDIINKLNAAGAEAIAINDQRYMATTEIYYTSNALYINSVPTNPPYQIMAIGNPETLEAAMNMRFGVVWNIKEMGLININVKKQNSIELPRYTKVTNFKFAKPLDIGQ
ncbi:DUF881 domain-containing protein [Alkaliphilus hydrothermalis]|uniref:Uncharacterized protein YlxW (UPF0749 family) n=1 Tax=Alkaliphilus hydrothermalis TaxID=1482730 RepID=A0ABS2NNV0_9FIRM|nr:DUF881 domain-containing protein [Alkaliphilus hydrothermalis]MBM7614584.1 uncharacterized protein YlxW (UPF0749 family) [Alkaliphilus hydrothermalis]